MAFIINGIKILFLLGFLVFIHESGHFIVAKKFGVNVKEFSLGFGPRVFSKQKNETMYSVRAIPLGGYVDMLGENERKDEEGSFSKLPVLKRIAIVAAGGIVNIIFGILVYFILVSFIGINVSKTVDEKLPESMSNLSSIEVRRYNFRNEW